MKRSFGLCLPALKNKGTIAVDRLLIALHWFPCLPGIIWLVSCFGRFGNRVRLFGLADACR